MDDGSKGSFEVRLGAWLGEQSFDFSRGMRGSDPGLLGRRG